MIYGHFKKFSTNLFFLKKNLDQKVMILISSNPNKNPFVYEVGEEEAPTDWIMQAHDDFDASGENWNSHIYAFSRQ